MVATAIVGSTGLVGSNMLSVLLSHSTPSTVSAFTRRSLQTPDPNSRLRPVIDSDAENWVTDFSSLEPKPSIFYSALGTTRANAGGLANQRKIDYDLNISLAKAAQENGAKVYVLISSGGVSSSSIFPYLKLKGELEDAVKKLSFDKIILVKPGLLVGTRTESRPSEYALQLLAAFMGKISGGLLKDFWAQDADVVGKAAVSAGLKALQGDSDVPEGKVWVVNQSDIIRLGRTEWK